MTQPSELGLQEDKSIETSLNSDFQLPIPCYFMVTDILGFSQLISNLPDDAQSQRINEWIDLVQNLKLEIGIKDTQLISDTLFVREEDSETGLGRLLQFAQLLLNRGIERSFPIRGAIVYGDAAWGPLTYGRAVIQAHEAERSLDWIGIACSPKMPRIDSFWSWDLVAVYPAPQKSGLTRLLPAVAWDVPLAQELVKKATGCGFFKAGERIPWHVTSKIERTLQFGMYLRWGKHLRLDPKSFRGVFPMHIIEILSGTSQ